MNRNFLLPTRQLISRYLPTNAINLRTIRGRRSILF